MRKKFKGYLFIFVTLATVVVAIFGAGFVSANEHSQKAPHAGMSGSGKKATASMVAMHVIDMQKVAAETATTNHRSTALPFLTGVSASVYAQRKAGAAHNPAAPTGSSNASVTPRLKAL